MKKLPPMTIDVTTIRREVVTAKEFLRLSKESPHLIARSRFVPPMLGHDDFGAFDVHYSVPVLKRVPAR